MNLKKGKINGNLWLENNEDVSIMPLKRLGSRIASRERLKAQEFKKKALKKIAAKHLKMLLLNKVKPCQIFILKCRPTFKNVHLSKFVISGPVPNRKVVLSAL